jgi:peptidoglycan/xylan/chitin deacetylase (PgdA/CDA1 family)
VRDIIYSLAAKTYLSISRTPRLTVLTLHRVGNSSKIQQKHVERCFRLLKAYFNVIRPSELDFSKQQRLTAVITIDDGHSDVYHHIFPIAKAFNIPIALCIPTDFFFRNEWLWFDKFAWIMGHAKCGMKVQINELDFCTDNPESVTNLKYHLKRCRPQERNSFINQIAYSLGVDLPSSPPDEYKAIAPHELREMLSSGLVDIVGHTKTHTIATVLNDEDFESELRQSKKEWEAFCGSQIISFCYPNGNQGDFNKRTAALLIKTGYKYAFTQIEGTNLIRTLDPFELKRVHIHWRPGICDKLISGLGDMQRRYYHLDPGE